jgi:hypothetical protein
LAVGAASVEDEEAITGILALIPDDVIVAAVVRSSQPSITLSGSLISQLFLQ